jgi:hypothetical protein
MHRSPFIVSLCAAAIVMASIGSASADNSMSSGSMAGLPKDHQYLIGTWTCAVQLAAMQGQPASTDHGAMSIGMAPNMSLNFHIVAKDYRSDEYEGYDSKTKTHWATTADSQGDATLETSTDGVVFTGTTWQAGTSTPARDTQTKISDTKIRDVTELKMNGKWTKVADAVCTKG